jgi:CMP-N,N'-diacetyllegionaminic acid synthase
MTKNLRLALIPARSGSKGIKNKNIVSLGGVPLINWTIYSALASKLFDIVCVSTDSIKISRIASEAGAEVPFLRPNGISTDTSLQIDVIKHCLEFYLTQDFEFQSVTLLQPTAPFRKIEDLVKSLNLFEKSSCETLISVRDMTEYADSTFYSGKYEESILKLFPIDKFSSHNRNGTLRQEFPKKYWRNGSIYIFKPVNIVRNRTLLKKPIIGFEMPWDRSINIDSLMDLEIARILSKHHKDLLLNKKNLAL